MSQSLNSIAYDERAASQLGRLRKESNGVAEDIDRTPTKRDQILSSSDKKATAAKEDSRSRRDGANKNNSEAERLPRQTDTVDSTRLPSHRMRYQSSTVTLRSPDFQGGEHDSRPSSSTARISSTSAAATREERKKKSAIYEQEILQMRSESRLGDHDDGVTDRSVSRASTQRAADTTDTSGTEGSGPVIANRRRKKSSISASSKRAAGRATNRDNNISPPKEVSPRKERLPPSSFRPTQGSRSPHGPQTSPLRTESAFEYASSTRSPSTYRAPLLNEPIRSRFRSDELVETQHEQGRRRNSIGNGARQQMWPRGETLPESDRLEERRRRDNADGKGAEAQPRSIEAASSEAASSKAGRVAVEASDISRNLSRTSKYGTLTDTRSLAKDTSERVVNSNQLTSDLMRQRKISASSSISQRSSGGASELHRSASRASMRRSHGRDVFDDGGAPPLPDNSTHPLSPRFSTLEQYEQNHVAAQSLREKQEGLRGGRTASGNEGWRKEIESLQERIDQLTVATNTQSQVDPYSRSSSRASVSGGGRSNIVSTPSVSISRRANRPSTEPRNTRNGNDRAFSEYAPFIQRYEASSRLSHREAEHHRTLPVTPNTSDTRGAGSSSRLAGVYTGPLPSTGRFPSSSHATKASTSSSAGSGPLHERNLLNSVEAFERFLLDSIKTASDSPSNTIRSAPDALELINRFRETSETAININAGLRTLLQSVLDYQIDAEVRDGNEDNALLFQNIDKSLSHILRESDEQMRSLTDGLLIFTRQEKDRDRLRRRSKEPGNTSVLSGPRSSSRLSTYGLLQVSPEKERRYGMETRNGEISRSSSSSLRRGISIRDGEGVNASDYAVPSIIQAIESRSQASDKSSLSGGHDAQSKRSSNSSQQSRSKRQSSLLKDTNHNHNPANFPPSPYSPSPLPTNSGTISSRIRASITSPSLGIFSTTHGQFMNRRSSTLGHSNGMNHVRSASEISPKISTREGVEGLFDLHQSPASTTRRDKTSSGSAQTVKAPTSLSPRRPRLSFPKVSATTVGALTHNSNASTMMDDGELSQGSEVASVRLNGGNDIISSSSAVSLASTSPDSLKDSKLTLENLKQNEESSGHVNADSTASRIFKSLGRNAGMRMAKDLS
ncbi:hypothetical protein CBS101457_006815 [Exobasidium rhododendri]|nr:hypothetical protein CBS101457_006815 [Exobasidium rhododendri]